MQKIAMRPVLLVAALLMAGCSSTSAPPQESGPEGSARFVVAMQQALGAEDVVRVEVTLDAFDITPNTIPLEASGQVWSGTMSSIRAGVDRRFHAEAFDAAGNKIYDGEVDGVTIEDGQTVQVNILAQQVNAPPPFENEAPVIDSIVVSRPSIEPGSSITLQAAAHDPNPGDTLTYAWTATDGTFSDASSLDSSWTAPATNGNVTLTFTATDQIGTSAAISFVIQVEVVGRGNADVTVSFNSWPVVSTINANTTQVPVGQSITATAVAEDPDTAAGSLSYSWVATCTGTWAGGNTASGQFTPTQRPGNATCNNCELTVTVRDGRGGVNTGKLAICVGSIATPSFPPQIASVYQATTGVTENSSGVRLRINATETQNRLLTYSWSTNIGTLGTPTSNTSGTTSEVLWAAPSCLRNGVTPTVTVRVSTSNTPDLYTDHSFTFNWSGKLCSGTDGDLCFDGNNDYLAHWTFDTTTQDSSPWANHLVDFDADPFVEGVYDQAGFTQGRFMARRSADDEELDFGTGAFTIAAWVKIATTVPAHDRWLLSKANDYGQNGGWSLRSYYGRLYFHTQEGELHSTRTVANNTWTHVAVVRDANGQLKFYINGALDSTHSLPNAIADTAAVLTVGARGNGGSPIQGAIDELVILQREATAHELGSLAQKSCR